MRYDELEAGDLLFLPGHAGEADDRYEFARLVLGTEPTVSVEESRRLGSSLDPGVLVRYLVIGGAEDGSTVRWLYARDERLASIWAPVVRP